jgi:hypothetical protein
MTGVRLPVGAEFSLLHSVQTGPPNLLSNEYRGVKRPGRQADNPTQCIEIKNYGAYLHCPIYFHGVVLN